jgi:hypothetical protein
MMLSKGAVLSSEPDAGDISWLLHGNKPMQFNKFYIAILLARNYLEVLFDS